MRKHTRMSAKIPQKEREISLPQAQRTDLSRPSSAMGFIMPLQASIGNRAVQRLLQSGTMQPERRAGHRRKADGEPNTPGLRKVGLEGSEAEDWSQAQLRTSQTTSLIQAQRGGALEERKQRGQRMAKDIIGAIKVIRDVYLNKYGPMNPMTIVLLNIIKRRKGPWDQYLAVDAVKKNYGKRDVRHVSYMEKTVIETTRYGLVNGWTFTEIAESWNKIWQEAVQGVAYVRKGLQQYDVTYRPMVEWMLESRYRNSVLFYLVAPDPGFWKKMWLWLTSQSP